MDVLAFPKLDQYVNDFSSVLRENERKVLNELFASHEGETGEQVVVVFFPHRDGHELLDIGLKVFNENGIGQRGKNNGLLLIVSTEEKKIRLITGKGMEIKYSEMRCRDIIEGKLRPLLNTGSYAALIRTFSEIIKSTEVYHDSAQQKGEKEARNTTRIVSVIGSILSVIALIFVDSFISGTITLGIAFLLFFIISRVLKNGAFPFARILYIFPGVLLLIGIIGITQPANCILEREDYWNGKSYSCERNIFGHQYSYTKMIGGHSSMNNSSSSSSHWDSGGSSFGGGGGSSNGGGYGD